MSDSATIATVNEYDELIAALRDRAAAMGYTNLSLDEMTGLPTGYSGKLLGPGMVKTLGPLSFGVVMQALGLRVVLEVDPEALAKVKRRGLRERSPVMPNRLSITAMERYIPLLSREFGRKGGKASAAKRMVNTKAAAKKRSRHASIASRARWKKSKRQPRYKKAPPLAPEQ